MAWARLYRGDELLGTLHHDYTDQPFFHARFEPEPAFEAVRPLFDEEAALLDADGELFDGAAWEKAYDRVDALGLRLVFANGDEVTEMILHVRGDRASVRC